ncbi:hypothetical protein [Haladaptatus sp. CMAA 1911]|uniref:hypothetical protein n=1 Tax=Haladaptatus sp. CMAA 1911 TaxID=3368987 RepID=UPI0037548B38
MATDPRCIRSQRGSPLQYMAHGTFCEPDRGNHQRESDVDVVLAFESFDAIDEFDYDGRFPETIEIGGITREFDLIIDGPASEYDDGESEVLYARPNDDFE